jgi:hypothetical protein
VPSVSGIPVHRFVLPADPFLSEITQPANAAYYAGGPDGVANVSTCCFKANVFMSKPHFLDGDAQLLKNVTVLAPPNPALHDTYYDIEPVRAIC